MLWLRGTDNARVLVYTLLVSTGTPLWINWTSPVILRVFPTKLRTRFKIGQHNCHELLIIIIVCMALWLALLATVVISIFAKINDNDLELMLIDFCCVTLCHLNHYRHDVGTILKRKSDKKALKLKPQGLQCVYLSVEGGSDSSSRVLLLAVNLTRWSRQWSCSVLSTSTD